MLDNIHIAGVILAFPAAFVTFLVALWPTDFRGALEAGGYVAMVGAALIVLVHLDEATMQPPALHRNWVVTGRWYAVLASVTVLLWGIGFGNVVFGLFCALVAAASISVGTWWRHLAMRGLDRPPAEWNQPL